MNFNPGGKFFDLSTNFNKLESDRVKIGCGKTSILQYVPVSFIALQILNAEAYLTVFTPEQLKVPVGLILNDADNSNHSLYTEHSF